MSAPIAPPNVPPNHRTGLFPLGSNKGLGCRLFAGGARNNKMRRALRAVLMAAVAAALLMQPSYVHAQHSSPPSGPSEKEKAKVRDKMILEKETDEAYKSTITRIPDSKQKVDPWGNIRTPPAK